MSNTKICVNEMMPLGIKHRKSGSVWVRPSSGKMYSVNEYDQLYVTTLGSALVNLQGNLPWFNEALSDLRECLNSQGIPTNSMAVSFQKCKEATIAMLNSNAQIPQEHKVPKGVNVLHLISNVLKAVALKNDPSLKEVVTPLMAEIATVIMDSFESEQPQLFIYGGAFFGKYRVRIAPIMLAIANGIQTDADLGNFSGEIVTGDLSEDRSALVSYVAGVFDTIVSNIS
jgi:hypothetical protein